MTVAAIIVAPSPDAALRLVDGEPAIRRIARAAWAGGAIPILVAAPDPDGRIASALGDTEARLAPPSMPGIAPERWHDRVADEILAAAQAAADGVIGTTAILVWPVKRSWVGPETVTSLIEAHGAAPEQMIRPTFHGEAGLPTLVPIESLENVLAGRTGQASTAASTAASTTASPAAPAAAPSPSSARPRLDLGAQPRRCISTLLGEAAENLPSRKIELGDPGTIVNGDVPREELASYEGPLHEERTDAAPQGALADANDDWAPDEAQISPDD